MVRTVYSGLSGSARHGGLRPWHRPVGVPQRVGWGKAEIAADIGDDGGRRTVTERGSNLLGCGEIGERGGLT